MDKSDLTLSKSTYSMNLNFFFDLKLYFFFTFASLFWPLTNNYNQRDVKSLGRRIII